MVPRQGLRVNWFDLAGTGLAGAGDVTVLSRDEVRRCLAELDAVDVVRATLAAHDRGESLLPAEAYLKWENSQGAYTRSIGMPGAVRSHYGMKIINASVSNPSAGLERAGGIGLCFDEETARITTIMEAGLLSAVRTAAVSAVGVDAAGYSGARSLAIVGCGAQGRMHAALLTRRLPGLRAVSLYDRSPEVAHALAATLADFEVTVHADARSAVATGEIAVFTTTVDEGYVEPDWPRPGALLVNVSLGDLTDATFLDAAAVYVDDLDLVADNPRRPLGRLLAAGLVSRPGETGGTARPIDATLGGLLTGRHTIGDVKTPHVVLNPFGMGVLDVALYGAVAAQARRAGIGATVHLG
jgi:ornithine cyclodeaminase